MTVKDELHELVDQLDEDAAREALAYLQTLRLPAFLRDAPLDDEPETEEERAAVAEAEADFAAGRVVSHEAIRREFGE
jgi:predicted transcriptional regulator